MAVYEYKDLHLVVLSDATLSAIRLKKSLLLDKFN